MCHIRKLCHPIQLNSRYPKTNPYQRTWLELVLLYSVTISCVSVTISCVSVTISCVSFYSSVFSNNISHSIVQ